MILARRRGEMTRTRRCAQYGPELCGPLAFGRVMSNGRKEDENERGNVAIVGQAGAGPTRATDKRKRR